MADSIRLQLPQYSMLSSTPIYHGISAEVDGVVQDVVVPGLMQSPVVPDPSDILYTVQAAAVGRLDLISNKFYKVVDLWWVIARVNHIIDTLTGPSFGDVIRIPTKPRLAALGILNI